MKKQVVFPDREVVVLDGGRAFQTSQYGMVFSLEEVAEIVNTTPDPRGGDFDQAIVDTAYDEALAVWAALGQWPKESLDAECLALVETARIISAEEYLAGGDQ